MQRSIIIPVTLHESGKFLEIPVSYTVEKRNSNELIYKCRVDSDNREILENVTTHVFDIKAVHNGLDIITRLGNTPIGNVTTCDFIDEISDRIKELEIRKVQRIAGQVGQN